MSENISQEEKPASKPDTKLSNRMFEWAMERFDNIPPKIAEANARFKIANALEKDMKASGRMEPAEYEGRVKGITKRLEKSGFEGVDTLKSEIRKDSITGEEYFTRIRREGDSLVAEEIGHEGRIITKAKVGSNGQTELTLNFRSKRYAGNSNPAIIRNTDYVNATLTTFELLADTIEKTDK